MTTEGGELSAGWELLVPRVVHPTKVAIIEAIRWIERPLSATDLSRVFGGEWGLSQLSYHLRSLGELGALTIVRERPGRGSVEKFYFFP